MLKKLGTKNPKLNLPPGPRKLPFIGNLHLFAGQSGFSIPFCVSRDPPHIILRNLAKKYGPIMHLRLGEVDNIIVTSPEIAKQFLKTHDIVFANRPSLLATEIGGYGNTDIAFSPYGEYWRQLRKICTLELLSARRVKSFQPIREEEVSALQEGSQINLTEKLSTTNNDIMARAALGKKSDEKATFIDFAKEFLKFTTVFHIVDVYPSIKFFHPIVNMTKSRIEKLHQELDRIIGNIIQERKRAYVARTNEGDKKHDQDLLDVLLKVQGSGSFQLPFTTHNVKSVLLDMFSAGTETSAIVVEWAMVEMLKNPTILNKAQDEVRQVFDDKHRVDESYFDELKGNRFEYIPFGAGKRICPGMSFGLANVELPLAMFLYHFDWILPDGMKPEDLEMTEISDGAAIRRNQDLCVIPVVRRPLFAT
ncbi:hypothetical protein DH2020_030344 [Rehmannia glutinosa]|uniref:Uncharacterized protein n=1 Tax=Rehmannia glutinosa TaxID=99300 RepID=A0ABR0VP05_REHGL